MDKEQADKVIELLSHIMRIQAMRGYNEARIADGYSIGFAPESFAQEAKL